MVSNKQLFCSACREEISVKKSIIELHVRRLESSGKRDMDIAQALQAYDSEVHPSGERLPESTRVYRVKLVTALLKAGTPLSKIDNFRELLEEHAFSLSDSSNLCQLLPFILREELQ